MGITRLNPKNISHLSRGSLSECNKNERFLLLLSSEYLLNGSECRLGHMVEGLHFLFLFKFRLTFQKNKLNLNNKKEQLRENAILLL